MFRIPLQRLTQPPALFQRLWFLFSLSVVEIVLQLVLWIWTSIWTSLDILDMPTAHGLGSFVLAVVVCHHSHQPLILIFGRRPFWFRFLILGLFHQWCGTILAFFFALGYGYGSLYYQEVLAARKRFNIQFLEQRNIASSPIGSRV